MTNQGHVYSRQNSRMPTYRYTLIAVLTMVLSTIGLTQDSQNCGFNLFDSQHNDAWIDRGLVQYTQHSPEGANLILPIVFHVVQDGTLGSLTDADVLTLLGFLNDAFANEGFYDPSTGADTDIGFCLAKQDENGLPTSGITRTQSTLTLMTAETQDRDLKALIHWDPHCYINVYLVAEINSDAYGTGVRGYANFPSSHGSPTDGIVIETNIANGSPVNAAVLIHEMGHFLGLFHTFRGGCTNNDCNQDGDRICDTPPDNSTAPSECSDPYNSCQTDAQSGLPSDQPDPVTNYMDYGHLSCRNQFTQDQAARMQMAVNTQRLSMLACESCDDPCPNPFVTTIGFDSLTVRINGPFRLWADNPPAGATYEWYENGMIVSTQQTLNTTYMTEGERMLVLKTIGADPRCVSIDTIFFEVYCDAFVTHNLRDTFCLTPGSTLNFSANGQRVNGPIEWYIDGILDQTGNQFSWTVPSSGVFDIHLVGKNANCEYTSIVYKVYVSCREICDNEVDDDGDGLIDGFDTDCCDSVSHFFFDPCYLSCPIEIKDAFTSIQRKYTTSGFEWHEAGSPLVGDINGDGKVEIIGTKTFVINGSQKVTQNYFVLNGEDGSVLNEVTVDGTWRSYSQQLAMADTDRNGYAEIYSFTRNFTRYDVNPDGSITKTYQLGGGAFVQPSITDVDEDGLAEIVVQNGIYDAQTGRALVGLNTSINRGGIDWVASTSGSAVVDVLPDDFCPDCSGKELIVGNQVYSIRIDRQGVSGILLQVDLGEGRDGYTSIADMDLDGDLDAVVVYTTPLPDFKTERHVLVWDIQTPNTLIREYTWPGDFDRIGQAAVGDVNGDGFPEIVIADRGNLRCLGISNNTWLEYFKLGNSDGSGMACPSLFDFDADGKMEIIHRDERILRIVDGSTGGVLFSESCVSGTGWETPVVADVDGDQEAELLCSCEGELRVYEPDPGRWALTRPVWNQRLYYSVNVNDDLTIPYQQQVHHLPGDKSEFNSYIFQYGTKEFKAGDLEGTIISMDCQNDKMVYEIEICNIGPATFIDSLHLTGYDENPSVQNASVVYTKDTLMSPLFSDSCTIITISFDRDIRNLYLVINDDASLASPYDFSDDFPVSDVFECDYTNNLIPLQGVPRVSAPDLGPDTTMCDFGTFVLDAGPGFLSYVWPDFSEDQTYTVWQPGTYWVVVMDACGTMYTDTIEVRVDPATIIDLGADRQICEGDSLVLEIPNYNQITWAPSDIVSCKDCPKVVLYPDTTMTISVVAETENGCFSFDSIEVTVGDGFFMHDTAFICQGDSILFDDIYRTEEGVYEINTSGTDCDSLIRLTVLYEGVLNYEVVDTVFLNIGETYQLSVTGDQSQIENYFWDSELNLTCSTCPNPTIIGEIDGRIVVQLILDNGCTLFLQIEVVIEEEEEEEMEDSDVFVPNIFSPNGDGLNDQIQIFTNDPMFVVEKFTVFDRWGELIYQEGPIEVSSFKGWDGHFNEKLVNPGVYVIDIIGQTGSGEQIHLTQGLTLMY